VGAEMEGTVERPQECKLGEKEEWPWQIYVESHGPQNSRPPDPVSFTSPNFGQLRYVVCTLLQVQGRSRAERPRTVWC